MTKARRTRYPKPQVRSKKVNFEKRVIGNEKVIFEENRVDKLERITVRIAGFIALLLTLLTVLIGKLADLITLVIHLAVLTWHAVER